MDNCARLINPFLNVSLYLVWIAFICGVIYVIIDLISKYIEATTKPPPAKATAPGGGIFDAATALIEALTKAPAWFSLFVGALALLWIASNEMPKLCSALYNNAKPPVGQETGAPPKDNKANTIPATPGQKPTGAAKIEH